MRLLQYSAVCLLLTIFTGKADAQVYSSDDITITVMQSTMHDSTLCLTSGSIFYMATINNSYAGDIVKIKDLSGNEYYQDVNFSGQNPWNVVLPYIQGLPIYDDNVIGGNLFYPLGETKVTTLHDTVYNIQNIITAYVPDACAYSTISGRVYVDNNENCQYDSGDDNLNALPVSVLESLSSPSISAFGYTAYSQSDGSYSRMIQSSWFTTGIAGIPIFYQFAFGHPACAPAYGSFSSLPSTVDFPLTCTSNIDLEAMILSQGNVRPNMPFFLFPEVQNTGCEAISGIMKLVLDPEVTYNAALSGNPANSVSGDTLIWNFANLTNISSDGYWNSFIRSIHLTPSLNVNIGDMLCFKIISTIPSNDVNPSNNVQTVCLPVVNSYDPNVKEVEPQGLGSNGYIPAETEKLAYTIHFQNTGNDVAFDVNIIDTLEENVIPSSLRILGTTHYMQPVWIAPNVVKFQFQNINLADSASNEPASHGAVSFEIELEQGLAPGTQILNTAHIYFDFNDAIVTNSALNTIAYPLGLEEKNKSVSVYPNPASTVVFVKGESAVPFELITISGQKIMSGTIHEELNVSALKEGIYLLKLQTAEGLQTEHIVISR